MSVFGDAMRDCGLPALLDQLGQAVTYGTTSVTALVEPSESVVQAFDDGTAAREELTLTIRLTDVAAPKLRDAVTVGGKVYFVCDPPSIRSDCGFSVLRVRRTVQDEKSGQGHRISR